MPEMVKTIQVPVTPPQLQWLERESKRQGNRSIASLIREALDATMALQTAEAAE